MKKTRSNCKFKEGDVVMLNKKGLRWSALTPARLVEQGKPNKFHVIKVKNWERAVYPHGTISLDECCGRAIAQNATCTGHPAEYFSAYIEKVVI